MYVEGTFFDLPALFVNGGKRGFLVFLSPDALRQALGERLREVEAAPAPLLAP